MSDFQQPIKVIQHINAAPQQVYASFASSIALESWLSVVANVQLQEGGRIFLWWDDNNWYTAGKINKVIENQLIQFDWRGEDEAVKSVVEIEITPIENGTQLVISHTCEQEGVLGKEHLDGWTHFLGNLKSVLETGRDQRAFTRPMLGVYIDGLVDQELAEKLGMSEVAGVAISGTIEGMGAQAAGLQAEDVILELNGHEIKSFSDFPIALKGKVAGDQVDLRVFRDGTIIDKAMQLSTREEPQGLRDLDIFAKILEQEYADVDQKLTEVFKGITDDQASVRPAEGEWSAKDVLAHILYNERWVHFMITGLYEGIRPGGYSNDQRLLSALADAYSVSDLLREIRLAEQVTFQTIRNLPEDFTSDKRKVGQLVMFLSPSTASHTVTHFEQIKEVLKQ